MFTIITIIVAMVNLVEDYSCLFNRGLQRDRFIERSSTFQLSVLFIPATGCCGFSKQYHTQISSVRNMGKPESDTFY
jgi:hypothetical protein